MTTRLHTVEGLVDRGYFLLFGGWNTLFAKGGKALGVWIPFC